ncbi:MAG: 3-hydroxyacyl-CoA dehydrogenase NAD-binding domain-containing protein [Gammaproteobacteria bacterium]|nr:3-hydroxyacyl-CoA dehydrogenase NAD-binding domain-containing protein [Gammaproteobacteria bacterium]
MTTTYKNWQLEIDQERIAWAWLDCVDSSANTLSHQVVDELNGILDELAGDSIRGLVIASAKQSGFILGADVKEFTSLTDPNMAFELIRRGQAVMDRIEMMNCPTVAMINGLCLGGGLELALACRYRIAEADSGRLGLPEVKLGIHPGFGGSVRSIQLLGVPAAMDLMLTGRTIDARRAAKIGLINYAVPERQLKRAATGLIMSPPKEKPQPLWKRTLNKKWARPLLAKYLWRKVEKKASPEHYPAPFALIDLWLKFGDEPSEMLREEALSVARLISGDTAQNLIRVFFLQEKMKAAGKLPGYAPRRVHVIGGGVMGGDIAAWCAMQGFQVTVQDRSHESLARVMSRAYKLYQKKLKRPRPIQAAMDRLMPDIDGHGLPRADVVIEAIFEDLEAKQALFREVEAKVGPDTLLCTNTSSIPLEEISTVLKDPGRLVGLHFFNPVAQMQLVEVVESKQSRSDVVEQAAAFTHQIKRLPLQVKSSPGFLVNRVLMPYLMEAVNMVEEGISVQAIDKAALKFGMPMGPITLADTVGLDICLHVAENLSSHLGGEVPKRLQKMVAAGQLGKKSGQGFYQYDKRGQRQAGGQVSDKSSDEVIQRLVMRYVNEAVTCLREGVVEDRDLLDAGMIFGTGFAPFRGGPMNYIQREGVEMLHQRMKQLQEKYGERFSADKLWAKL